MAASTPPSVFKVDRLEFPYPFVFPNQALGERTLFVTRENERVLWWRRLLLLGGALGLVSVAGGVRTLVGYASPATAHTLWLFLTLGGFVLLAVGWWWVTACWRSTLSILTTRQLIQCVQISPFHRRVECVQLRTLADSWTAVIGITESLLRLGSCVVCTKSTSTRHTRNPVESSVNTCLRVRSISFSDELSAYIHDLVRVEKHPRKLQYFPPFVGHLQEADRARLRQEYPEFWS